jgi:hypothetical protein
MDGSFAQAPLSSMLWAEAPKSRKTAEEMTRVWALLDAIIMWFLRLVRRDLQRNTGGFFDLDQWPAAR